MSSRARSSAQAVFELRSASMTLVVVALKTTDMQSIERALTERFAGTPGMFDHDPVVIDIGQAEGDPRAIDWQLLAALLWRFDMVAAAVRGGTPEQMAAAFAAGLGHAPDAMALPRAPVAAVAGAAGSAAAAVAPLPSAGAPAAGARPAGDDAPAAPTAPPAPTAPAALAAPTAPAALAAPTAPASPTAPAAPVVPAAAAAAIAASSGSPAAAPAHATMVSAAPTSAVAAPADPTPPESAAAAAEPAPEPPMPVAATLIVDRPLRSGQQVYARGGDLVVLAVVSFGAEVIADGSIHVYAPLRGKAIAGAKGDSTARIFSTCLEPQLIAIAGTYRTTDSPLPANVLGKPAQIRLDGERLVFESLG